MPLRVLPDQLQFVHNLLLFHEANDQVNDLVDYYELLDTQTKTRLL